MIAPILLRQVRALLRTLVDHVSDDPVVFAMQVSRRLPHRVSHAVGHALSVVPGTVAQTASVWLRGDVNAAAELVRARAATARGARVLGELALSLGDRRTAIRAAEASAHTAAGLRLAARLEWHAGNMSAAVKVVPDGRMRERLASELRIFRPAWTPSLAVSGVAPTPRGLEGTDVLFALTNSLPHTQSGYTLRSHAVLGAVRDAGVRVLGANRSGYPTSIGKPLLRDSTVVDGIGYLFDVPTRLGRTLENRLEQQASFLAQVARATRAQAIHTTTHFTNGLAAQAAAASLGLPWIYEVRGALEDTWASARGTDESAAWRSEKFALFRAREAQVAKAADRVITLGDTMARELVERGVNSEKIFVAHNSVGKEILDANWHEDPGCVRETLGLPKCGIWVGTASSIVPYEGLDVLIDAITMARQSGSDIRMLIVGDGTELPTLRIRAEKLADAAIFTGRLSPVEARRYVQAMDIFVVPRKDASVCRKITPLKPVEAGGLGRPVVLSNLPALDEALPVNARRLVAAESVEDLAGALADLASDSEERARLGSAARAYVEQNRTWKAFGTAYRNIYEELGVSVKGGGK